MSNSLQLIEESFERVRPRAPEFAASFYKNLFKAYPEIEPLFAETDMEAQKQKLISILMLVVFNLHYPQNLIDTLQELGSRHVKYGALPKHYSLVGHALLTTFEQYLGKQWTREVKQAWVGVYADITALMLAGAEYDTETVKLEAPGEKADAGGASQVPQTHDHKADSLQLLEESFKRVRPCLPEFATSFYQNLFKAYPEIEPLFAKTDMRELKQKLIDSLAAIVLNIRYPQKLKDKLQRLGARHVKYGALPEHYPLLGYALLTTFEQYLGEEWTREVKQAWVDAYADITALMLAGAEYDGEKVKLEAPRKKAGAGGASQVPQTHNHKADSLQLLEESFKRIRPCAPEFATSFYENLFKAYPEIKPLFAKTDMWILKQKFIDSLAAIVLNIRYPQKLKDKLQRLGARHVKYDALPEHYPLLGYALLTTFEQYLGEEWTTEVQQAWVNAYADITALMLAGAEYDKTRQW